MTDIKKYWRMREALDAMLIWFHGEPCYRSSGGVPMGMPVAVRRKVKKALQDFSYKPGVVRQK